MVNPGDTKDEAVLEPMPNGAEQQIPYGELRIQAEGEMQGFFEAGETYDLKLRPSQTE